jgi:hypothetical protein
MRERVDRRFSVASGAAYETAGLTVILFTGTEAGLERAVAVVQP